MSDRKNYARDDAGITVTLVRRDRSRTTTVTRNGLAQEALRELLAPFDPVLWRVASVSTPRTILADIKGRALLKDSEDRQLGGGTRYLRHSSERALLGMNGLSAFL